MAFEDKDVVCVECSETFVFTAGEQEFYAGRGLTNEPRRCQRCRQARRGRRDFDGARQPREMYSAICAECGMETQVPFKPTGVRPVYCSDCFNKMRA